MNLLEDHRCGTVEPIRVSQTRMILKCAVCGRIIDWADRSPNRNTKKTMYYFKSGFSLDFAEQWC
jgi:hypothetical protein